MIKIHGATAEIGKHEYHTLREVHYHLVRLQRKGHGKEHVKVYGSEEAGEFIELPTTSVEKQISAVEKEMQRGRVRLEGEVEDAR